MSKTLKRIEAKLDLLLTKSGMDVEQVNKSIGGGGIKKPPKDDDDGLGG